MFNYLITQESRFEIIKYKDIIIAKFNIPNSDSNLYCGYKVKVLQFPKRYLITSSENLDIKHYQKIDENAEIFRSRLYYKDNSKTNIISSNILYHKELNKLTSLGYIIQFLKISKVDTIPVVIIPLNQIQKTQYDIIFDQKFVDSIQNVKNNLSHDQLKYKSSLELLYKELYTNSIIDSLPDLELNKYFEFKINNISGLVLRYNNKIHPQQQNLGIKQINKFIERRYDISQNNNKINNQYYIEEFVNTYLKADKINIDIKNNSMQFKIGIPQVLPVFSEQFSFCNFISVLDYDLKYTLMVSNQKLPKFETIKSSNIHLNLASIILNEEHNTQLPILQFIEDYLNQKGLANALINAFVQYKSTKTNEEVHTINFSSLLNYIMGLIKNNSDSIDDQTKKLIARSFMSINSYDYFDSGEMDISKHTHLDLSKVSDPLLILGSLILRQRIVGKPFQLIVIDDPILSFKIINRRFFINLLLHSTKTTFIFRINKIDSIVFQDRIKILLNYNHQILQKLKVKEEGINFSKSLIISPNLTFMQFDRLDIKFDYNFSKEEKSEISDLILQYSLNNNEVRPNEDNNISLENKLEDINSYKSPFSLFSKIKVKISSETSNYWKEINAMIIKSRNKILTNLKMLKSNLKNFLQKYFTNSLKKPRIRTNEHKRNDKKIPIKKQPEIENNIKREKNREQLNKNKSTELIVENDVTKSQKLNSEINLLILDKFFNLNQKTHIYIHDKSNNTNHISYVTILQSLRKVIEEFNILLSINNKTKSFLIENFNEKEKIIIDRLFKFKLVSISKTKEREFLNISKKSSALLSNLENQLIEFNNNFNDHMLILSNFSLLLDLSDEEGNVTKFFVIKFIVTTLSAYYYKITNSLDPFTLAIHYLLDSISNKFIDDEFTFNQLFLADYLMRLKEIYNETVEIKINREKRFDDSEKLLDEIPKISIQSVKNPPTSDKIELKKIPLTSKRYYKKTTSNDKTISPNQLLIKENNTQIFKPSKKIIIDKFIESMSKKSSDRLGNPIINEFISLQPKILREKFNDKFKPSKKKIKKSDILIFDNIIESNSEEDEVSNAIFNDIEITSFLVEDLNLKPKILKILIDNKIDTIGKFIHTIEEFNFDGFGPKILERIHLIQAYLKLIHRDKIITENELTKLFNYRGILKILRTHKLDKKNIPLGIFVRLSSTDREILKSKITNASSPKEVEIILINDYILKYFEKHIIKSDMSEMKNETIRQVILSNFIDYQNKNSWFWFDFMTGELPINLNDARSNMRAVNYLWIIKQQSEFEKGNISSLQFTIDEVLSDIDNLLIKVEEDT